MYTIIFFSSEGDFYFSMLGKYNGFQYSFVTIHFFCLIFINATVVQTFFSERKCKREITVKNPLTNNCNTMVDTTNKISQLN